MAAKKKGPVEVAVERDVKALGGDLAGSVLAETALALARELDQENSATSKSMCAKSMVEVLAEMRALVPPTPEEDEVERARKRRADRLARQSAAGTASSS